MRLRLFAAFAVSALFAPSALAQPAPAGPPAGWGDPPPAAQPLPARPAPQPMPQPGAYPPGAYPPGAYPPGAYPPPYASPEALGVRPDEPHLVTPDGHVRLLPYKLPYDPEMGSPPGYKLAEERRMGLVIAGSVTFGALWVASCFAGGITEQNEQNSYYYSNKHGWPLYIPLAGPFIAIGTLQSSAAGTTALIFDGLGQVGGLAMFIAGMVSPQQVLKYQVSLPQARVTVSPMAAPLAGGGFTGVTGTF